MSGSPKYTTVSLAAQRRAQLEAARRQREEERRRRQEEARQRRLEAGVRAARARTDGVAARLADLRRMSGALPQHADLTREAASVAAVAAELVAPIDEAALKRLGMRLRDAEHRTDRLTTAVARELTVREHGGALDLVVAQLDSVADRARLDPPGHRTVTTLTADVRSSVGDGRRFPEAHRRLSDAAGAHLDQVRDRQALLLRLATESDEVTGRLAAVLDDAERAGVAVPERAEVESDVAALRAESDGSHVTRWEHRLADLRRKTDAVAASVDARLDQLERMAIIVEAASAALPAAGLRIVEGSLVEQDDAVTFRASRADGVPIELTVHAGDGRGTRLEYRVDGADTVVETTDQGQVSRCDLTEELLERFHTQLGRQGVKADGLHWAGKPEHPRPPHIEAAAAPRYDGRGMPR